MFPRCLYAVSGGPDCFPGDAQFEMDWRISGAPIFPSGEARFYFWQGRLRECAIFFGPGQYFSGRAHFFWPGQCFFGPGQYFSGPDNICSGARAQYFLGPDNIFRARTIFFRARAPNIFSGPDNIFSGPDNIFSGARAQYFFGPGQYFFGPGHYFCRSGDGPQISGGPLGVQIRAVRFREKHIGALAPCPSGFRAGPK